MQSSHLSNRTQRSQQSVTPLKAQTLFLTTLILISSAFPVQAQSIWTQAYGGSDWDEAASVIQTSDEGFLVVGYTSSFGAGGDDFWLVKTDLSGDTLWTKTFGGPSTDEATSVIQTVDNGYMIGGTTRSWGAGSYDAWLIKTDSIGDTLWTRTYGGSRGDEANSVIHTPEGGYLMAGYTKSFGNGNRDIWLVCIDSLGDTLWTRTYGGVSNDVAMEVIQSNDDGYIVCGYTASFGAGSNDLWLLKIDAQGDTLWTQTYGGPDEEMAYSVLQTLDDGIIISGHTYSFGSGMADLYLVKTDSEGDLLWTRTFGSGDDEYAFSIIEEPDGSLMVAGATRSWGIGSSDYLLIKIDSQGDALWARTYGGNGPEEPSTIVPTADGGYLLAGSTQSFGSGRDDFWLVKTDSLGNSVMQYTEQARLQTILDGNQVESMVYNYGSIGRPNIEPSFVWPSGSGRGYAFEFGLLVGTKVIGDDGQVIHFIDDGLAVGGVFNGAGNYGINEWQPVSGYAAPLPNNSIARSDDDSNWPSDWFEWPQIGDTVDVESDLESYYVMNDRHNIRHIGEYTAIAEDTSYHGAGIEVAVRTFQWSSAGLEDVLLVAYDVSNISDHVMDSIVVGMRGDPHIGGASNYRDDNVGYIDQFGDDPFTGQHHDETNNLIYCWDTDGVGDDSFGDDPVGLFGIHLISHNEDDYFKSLSVPGYTNAGVSEDVWWSRFSQASIDTSTFIQDADNLVIWGSDFFSLHPDEHRQMFVAFVFGESLPDLLDNTVAIDNKYTEAFDSFISISENNTPILPTRLDLTTYPNPFNPNTKIEWILDRPSKVQLNIFNLLGQNVFNQELGLLKAGPHSLLWNGSNYASGVYIIEVRSELQSAKQKVVLLK
ncbi:MAG: T9SS type A sorting domain-containing protein [Candidatus Marinimicrobia bacterium]|nr:T9SS type A sorting domain-containing protein [Candidatus Neomarinimicrobiota bacterium]